MSLTKPYDLKSPKRIQIHPTDRCNLECGFCDRSFRTQRNKELSKEKWKEVLQSIRSLEPDRVIVVGGGEPTLRKDILSETIDQMNDETIYTSLVTNGVSLYRETIQKMINEGWNHIHFSLHSPFAKISDFLRGKEGSFKGTLENIRTIKAMKERMDSEEPTMAITSVLNRYNVNHLEELAEFVKTLDMEPLVLRNLQGEHKKFEVPQDTSRNIKKMIDKISKKVDIKLEFNLSENQRDERERNKQEPMCLSPFFEMSVFADGTVAPCCFMFDEEKYTENVRDKNLKDIWTGEKFEFLRQSSYTEERVAPCNECSVSQKEMEDLRPEFEKQYKQSLGEAIENNKC